MNYDNKDPDVGFNDPVVRCDSCHVLLERSNLQKLGMCKKCGNRRVRNVLVMSDVEITQLKEWGIDPDFIALFEEVSG